MYLRLKLAVSVRVLAETDPLGNHIYVISYRDLTFGSYRSWQTISVSLWPPHWILELKVGRVGNWEGKIALAGVEQGQIGVHEQGLEPPMPVSRGLHLSLG